MQISMGQKLFRPFCWALCLGSSVLYQPRLVAAVSAGLQGVEAKLADGRTVKSALAEPQGQATGGILLVRGWWGLV